MKKSSLLLAAAVAAGFALEAGATPKNYSLELTAGATADCGPLAELSGLENLTLQFWFCPSEWNEGATLLSRGDGFKVALAKPGTLSIVVGDTPLSVSSSDFAAGKWAQVTVVRDALGGKVFVNNEEVLAQAVGVPPVDAQSHLVFGGGFQGRLDEVRLFKTAIPEDFERFSFNTINKWHPQRGDLLVYYKFDMVGFPEVVDYKYIIDMR